MKFDELYKKVIDSCRAFEERRVPISLDFKIEDLRDALVESNDTIEQLKAKLESVQASAYADNVDAGMRERRLRRALYKACANWAHEKDDRYYLKYVCISDDARIEYERWRNVERKCLKKAEEYK